MKKVINLLPKEEIRELKLEQVSTQVAGFFIWVVVSLAVVLVLAITGDILLTQRINEVKADIEVREEALSNASTRQLENEVTALNKQIKFIEKYRAGHYYWSNAYEELSRFLPNDTYLTSVNMDREGQVVVNGVAGTRDSVIAFWSAVKKSSFFENVNFPLTNLEKDVDANFTFTFYIKSEEIVKE